MAVRSRRQEVDILHAAAAAACDCSATGTYVDPDGGSTISGEQTTSPHGTYTATWQSATGTVTVKKSAQQVLTTQGTVGGFSPDDHAFVTESLAGSADAVRLFNLDAPSPGSQIFGADPTVRSSRLVFSASGHYLTFGYTTASQTFFEVADATATSHVHGDADRHRRRRGDRQRLPRRGREPHQPVTIHVTRTDDPQARAAARTPAARCARR